MPRRLRRALLIAVAVPLVLGAALLARLAVAPMSLPVPQVALDELAKAAPPGWRVEASAAVIDLWGRDGLSGLRLDGLRVTDAQGEEAFAAPAVALRFALRPSLRAAEAVRLREVAVSGAALRIERKADGRLSLMAEGGTDGSDGGQAPVSPFALPPGLPSIAVEDASLTWADARSGRSWLIEDVEARFAAAEGGGSEADLSLDLPPLPDGSAAGRAVARVSLDPSGTGKATLTLDRAVPATLAGLDPILAELAGAGVPVSGTATLGLAPGGRPTTLDGTFTVGAGELSWQGEALAVEAADLRLRCTSLADCEIERAALRSDRATVAASGTVQPGERAAALELGAMRLALPDGDATARGGRLRWRGEALEALTLAGVTLQTQAVRVDLATVQAAQAGEGLRLVLGRPRLSSEGGSLSASRLGATLSGLPGVSWAETLVVSDVEGTGLAAETKAATATTARLHGSARLEGLRPVAVALDADEVSGGSDDASLSIGTVRGSWRDGSIEAAAEALRWRAEGAEGALAALSVAGDAGLEGISLRTEASGSRASVPALWSKPLGLSRVAGDLTAAPEGDGWRVGWQGVAMEAGGVRIAGGTSLSIADGHAKGRVDAQLGSVEVDRVAGLWPRIAAPGGRTWVAENVRGGTVEGLTVAAGIDTARPQDDRLALDFAVRDASVRFAPAMPPITGAAASGKVTLDRFDLALDAGGVSVPGGGTLTLGTSSVAIDDFAPRAPDGRFEVALTGAVADLLRLLDRPPLQAIGPTGLDIDGVTGEVAAKVAITLPLASDLRVEDVAFDARARVLEYALTDPRTGLAIEGDALTLRARPEGMELTSDARLDGIPARLRVAHSFERIPVGAVEGTLQAEAFVGLSELAARGLDLSRYMSGLAAVSARAEMIRGGGVSVDVEADLTPLALKIDDLGWRKPPHAPATMRLAGRLNEGGAALSLKAAGEGIDVSGSLRLDADRRLVAAELPRLRLGERAEVGLRYGRRADGSVGLRVDGPRLDLSGLGAGASGRGAVTTGEGDATQTDVAFQVGRLTLREGLTLHDAEGAARLRGASVSVARAQGRLNGTAPVSVSAERRPEGLALRATTPDAGALVRASGAYARAYDGALTLEAVIDDRASPVEGEGALTVEGLLLHDAPALRGAVSGTPLGPLLSGMIEGGIRFDRIELPFSGRGGTWSLREGVAVGPSLGVTLDGTWRQADDALSLRGALSPAHAVNGALGGVPVLGMLLTGGQGEGIIGVTFGVDGTSADPVLSVNPLAALAPGILRKLVSATGR